MNKLIHDGHVVKLDKCTEDCFISPIVITVKRDDTLKLALDAKVFNEAVVKDKYQMPNVDDLIDTVGQLIDPDVAVPTWFSCIDLKYAYSQITLSQETSRQCNFNIVGGQATGTYRFQTGFYGLADMPAEFQKMVDLTLGNSVGVYAFLDDILIVSNGSASQHQELILQTLAKLDQENLAVKFSKCHFFQCNQINWLGYRISKTGISPLQSKTDAILHLSPPRTLRQLRSFLGAAQHLLKFTPRMATLSAPLRNILKKSEKFVWTPAHTRAFENIKKAICGITENFHFGTDRPTRVKCDASHQGLGASLEQFFEGEWLPISFASRFLNPCELKYSTNELELLAVVWSLHHFS